MTTPGQQFKQLPMFMSGSEIKDTHAPWPGDKERHIVSHNGMYVEEPESDQELWDRKRDEADDLREDNRSSAHGQPSLTGSVLENGVQKPVILEDPQWTAERQRTPYAPRYNPHNKVEKPLILNGHHRIAVMADEDPHRLLPVTYAKDVMTARSELGDKF